MRKYMNIYVPNNTHGKISKFSRNKRSDWGLRFYKHMRYYCFNKSIQTIIIRSQLDQSKFFFISHLRYLLFLDTYINLFLAFSSLYNLFIVNQASVTFLRDISQFSICCLFFQFEPHKFSYNVTINHYYAVFNPTSPSSSVISHRSPYFRL